jgi:hypothetical protein
MGLHARELVILDRCAIPHLDFSTPRPTNILQRCWAFSLSRWLCRSQRYRLIANAPCKNLAVGAGRSLLSKIFLRRQYFKTEPGHPRPAVARSLIRRNNDTGLAGWPVTWTRRQRYSRVQGDREG